MAFKVSEVVNGNTLRIESGWKWLEYQGKDVVIKGININTTDGIPQEVLNAIAKARLEKLVLNREVQLQNPVKVEDSKLVCEVLFNGVDLSKNFPEYK